MSAKADHDGKAAGRRSVCRKIRPGHRAHTSVAAARRATTLRRRPPPPEAPIARLAPPGEAVQLGRSSRTFVVAGRVFLHHLAGPYAPARGEHRGAR